MGLPGPGDLSGCYMQAMQARLRLMILSSIPSCRRGHGDANDHMSLLGNTGRFRRRVQSSDADH